MRAGTRDSRSKRGDYAIDLAGRARLGVSDRLDDAGTVGIGQYHHQLPDEPPPPNEPPPPENPPPPEPDEPMTTSRRTE